MRTQQEKRDYAYSRVIEGSQPSATVLMDGAVRPRSIEVYVNGLRISRSLLRYDSAENSVTVPWLLLEGDTVTVRATRV